MIINEYVFLLYTNHYFAQAILSIWTLSLYPFFFLYCNNHSLTKYLCTFLIIPLNLKKSNLEVKVCASYQFLVSQFQTDPSFPCFVTLEQNFPCYGLAHDGIGLVNGGHRARQ